MNSKDFIIKQAFIFGQNFASVHEEKIAEHMFHSGDVVKNIVDEFKKGLVERLENER